VNLRTSPLYLASILLTAGVLASEAGAQSPAPSTFITTGSMSVPRTGHTATLLTGGKVLIAGGFANSIGYLSTAELYDPAVGTFALIGSHMISARALHTATVLPNGKVLIAGGFDGSGLQSASAELYDPSQETFSRTGSMLTGRASHTATLLPSGKVLIAGGFGVAESTAELYDPNAGTFTVTGSMQVPRLWHTATLLPDDRVLITGGINDFGGSTVPEASAEVYNPTTGIFTLLANIMSAPRALHTATALSNGRILLVGGTQIVNFSGRQAENTAEVFNPATNTFTSTGSMTTARFQHTATLLSNGQVLVAGGDGNTILVNASAELYDPVTGSFSATGSMSTARDRHTSTLLPNSNVLVTGGANGVASLASAEVFVAPAIQLTWTQKCAATTPPARYAHDIAYDTARGQVVLFGGVNPSINTNFNDTWVWDGTNWTQKFPATSPPARVAHAMAYDAARGQVVLFGGFVNGSPSAETWVWDGVNWTKKFPATSPPASVYVGMTYDAIRQQVVLFGGGLYPNILADTWVWDGVNWTKKFPATSPPARVNHRLAFDAARGNVVLFGSWNGNTFFNDTWTWDGISWTQQSPANSPPVPRFSYGLAYDTAQQKVVLFGGQGPNNTPLYNDTWAWDGTTWTQQLPANNPPGTTLPGMAYDQARSQIVVFGGFNGSFSSDTWVWGAPSPTTCPPPPGGGGGQPAISVSPSPITFLPTLLHQTFSELVTIKNPGTATLLISSITAPSPFVLVGQSTSIPAGGQDTLGVDFFATGPGPFAGNLVIVSNAPTSPTIIPLQATVILPDLSITSVRPVQVVYGVDLVLGKNTAFEVAVQVDYPGALPSSPIPIELIFEGISYPDSITADKFSSRVAGGFEAKLFVNPTPRIRPTSPGPHQVIARVNPGLTSVPESNPNNNESVSTVEVKETRHLRLVYITVPDCIVGTCYGPLTQATETVTDSNTFIKATYPVAEANYSGQLQFTGYLGDPIPCFGVSEDILRVARWGKRADPIADKVVGIVPSNYFTYHSCLLGVLGVTWLNFDAALVTEGGSSDVAHELGHMYGIAEEEYITQAPKPGKPASGYWVIQGTPIEDNFCFMGTSGAGVPPNWVDTGHFNYLLPLPKNAIEPTTLLITLLLHRNGSVDLRPWNVLTDAQVTKNMPGDYEIRVLDGTEHTLASLTLPVSFTMNVERLGSVPTDTVPILATIPYPETAATVEIAHGTQLLVRVSPTIKVLHDAIDAIPDLGFVQNPVQTRRALHNKIDALEKMLNTRATNGALQALLHDLRATALTWLIDGYVTTTPLELSKPEIIAVIDAMVIRVGNLGK